jgi:REP element-mobilizing transposase RayT
MTYYRRRLPHLFLVKDPLFLTWSLYGSTPPGRAFPEDGLTSGQAFAAYDRLLDEAPAGPMYLKQPPIADMVVEAIHYNAASLKHYELHAFAIMPNHVHLLVTPAIAIPKVTRSLKGITARRANEILGLTGNPFWQPESYDRVVRNQQEFEQIRRYIELNPVRAGLVREAGQYQWCSAGWPAGGRAADRGVHRTGDHS